jgi:glycine/D-amino acid oxidase-like deaminating enzyme
MVADAGPRLRVFAGVRVGRVLTAGARVAGVDTSVGLLAAPAVVLAAGAASTALARSAGVDLPLCNRAVGYCVFDVRADPGDLPTVVDLTTGMWLRRWHNGTAVLAGVTSRRRAVSSTVDFEVPVAERNRVREIARLRYPPLADAPFVEGVAAYDAMAPGEGAITAWPDPVGLVTATGWNGGGFKIAPAVGERVARLVCELIT